MKEYFDRSDNDEFTEDDSSRVDNLTLQTKIIYTSMLGAALLFAYAGSDSSASQRSNGDMASFAVALSLLAGIGLKEYKKTRISSLNAAQESELNEVFTVSNWDIPQGLSERQITYTNNQGEIEIFSTNCDVESFELEELNDDSSYLPPYKALDLMHDEAFRSIRFKKNTK